jgi:hypothetical protein
MAEKPLCDPLKSPFKLTWIPKKIWVGPGIKWYIFFSALNGDLGHLVRML